MEILYPKQRKVYTRGYNDGFVTGAWVGIAVSAVVGILIAVLT